MGAEATCEDDACADSGDDRLADSTRYASIREDNGDGFQHLRQCRDAGKAGVCLDLLCLIRRSRTKFLTGACIARRLSCVHVVSVCEPRAKE